MARRPKTPRFNQFNSFENCFGARQKHEGNWRGYLSDSAPLVLEIGCGKAEFTMELARNNSEVNYIGLDRKADRLWRPAKDALEQKIQNIAFIQTDIKNILEYFSAHEVDEIWVTFPDPYPKDRQEKHRLTNNAFLDLYKKLLKPGGYWRFKTDDTKLYEYTADTLGSRKDVTQLVCIDDLHSAKDLDGAKILTTYEKRWLKEGKITKYIQCSFKN